MSNELLTRTRAQIFRESGGRRRHVAERLAAIEKREVVDLPTVSRWQADFALAAIEDKYLRWVRDGDVEPDVLAQIEDLSRKVREAIKGGAL